MLSVAEILARRKVEKVHQSIPMRLDHDDDRIFCCECTKQKHCGSPRSIDFPRRCADFKVVLHGDFKITAGVDYFNSPVDVDDGINFIATNKNGDVCCYNNDTIKTMLDHNCWSGDGIVIGRVEYTGAWENSCLVMRFK